MRRGRAARRLPPQDREHRGLVGGLVGRQPGQHRERAPAQRGLARPHDRRRQRRPHLAALVPRADRRGRPGSGPPAADEVHPAVAGAELEPLVGGPGGGDQRLVDGGVLAHEARRARQLDRAGGGGLVDLEVERQPAQVAHGQAARAQRRRRTVAPGVQHLLHQPDGLGRRAGGQQVGPPGVDRAGRRHRRLLEALVHAAAAQRRGDLARQHHAVVVDRHDQPVPQRPAHRRAVRVVERSGGVGDRPHRRAGVQPVQQVARPGRAVREQGGDRRRRPQRLDEQVEVRGRVTRRCDAVGGEHRGEPGGGAEQAEVREPRSEPGGVRAEHLGEGAHGVQRAVGAPDQGQLAQPVDQRPGPPGGRPARPRQRGRRERLRQHGRRLGHLQRRPVEAGQGPVDAHAGRGPHRELQHVGRGGVHQVRTGAQQRDQRGVVAPAQVVGEAARGRAPSGGHPLNGTRAPRYREPRRRGRPPAATTSTRAAR